MRITGGSARGQILKVPRDIRPTTDRTREAIFSMLNSMGSREWSNVLDLFAGTGALGIEALSRDAAWADFVEKEPRCCDIIRQNLEKTGLSGQAHVYCSEVPKAIRFLDKEYGIILMDPPYSDSSIGNLLTQIATSKLVGADTILVVTHSPHLPLSSEYAALNLVKEHRHGDSCIALYRKEYRA